MATVKEIYDFINETAPFSLQESYDNSGICIGGEDIEVKKILVTLDCMKEVAEEAVEKGCQLIVTHHPIIFRAVKKIDFNSLVGFLAVSKISVISAHTNFDCAVMNNILCERLGLTPCDSIVEENGHGFGCICETEEISPCEEAEKIKNALGNKVVRFNDEKKPLKRIAVCSGSGGSFLQQVIEKGCDGYITGDVKHDIFIDAHNEGVCIFDAGHFHTENIFCEYMANALKDKYEKIDTEIASQGDILSYCFTK